MASASTSSAPYTSGTDTRGITRWRPGCGAAAGLIVGTPERKEDAQPGHAMNRTTHTELIQLLKAEIDKRGSARALAKLIGLTEGRLGRALRGEFSLSVEKCLRVSKIAGEPPSRVLRAAGKGGIADLIEDLYAVGDDLISPSERDLLARFRVLGPKAQRTLRDLLDELPDTGSRQKRA